MQRAKIVMNLDFQSRRAPPPLTVQRLDSAWQFVFELYSGGAAYPLEGCRVSFQAIKSDGTSVLDWCETIGNTATYNSGEQLTAVDGMVECKLCVYGDDGGRLNSKTFSILVEGWQEATSIESTTEVPLLQNLIENVRTLNVTADKAADRAKTSEEYTAKAVKEIDTMFDNFAKEDTLQEIRDHMAKSSETSPTEGTLEKIHDSLKQIVASVTGKVEDVDNWDQVAAMVQSGKHVLAFNTGDQLTSTWTDASGSIYDDPFDIVEVECSPELKNGQAVHGMMLQQHYANIANCPFDPQEALYDADEELPAGTYHFTVAGDTWLTSENGKKIQFTLAKPIPKGGQLVYANTEGFNVALAGQKISTYSGPTSFTAIETVVLSEGEEGADLGSTDGKGKLNHHQRAFRGCGRWKTSMLRQYLNSRKGTGQWWSKQDKWDRASTFINSVPGYMNGFPENFLGILRPVKVCTARDTVVLDGGTDITYDTFFFISLEQLRAAPQIEGVEGKALAYWKEIAANSADLDSSGRFKQYGTYPLLRTYGLNAKSSARDCWLRSAYRGYSYNAWYVTTSGYVYYSGALYGFSCAPACVIVAPQSSAANPLAASEG